MNRADLRGGNFSSGAHNNPKLILIAY